MSGVEGSLKMQAICSAVVLEFVLDDLSEEGVLFLRYLSLFAACPLSTAELHSTVWSPLFRQRHPLLNCGLLFPVRLVKHTLKKNTRKIHWAKNAQNAMPFAMYEKRPTGGISHPF